MVASTKPDRLVLLGDHFTKGPDPLGVWERIADWKPEAVLGNHDAKMLRVWGSEAPGRAEDTCRKLPDEARAWLGGLPTAIEGAHEGVPWIAVHGGLDPIRGLEGTDSARRYLMRRWPNDLDLQNPFWWQLWFRPEHVFYGHDAFRGLQAHARTTGLDTGCCYGNALSAYLLEERRLLQVRPDGTPIDPPELFWMDGSTAERPPITFGR